MRFSLILTLLLFVSFSYANSVAFMPTPSKQVSLSELKQSGMYIHDHTDELLFVFLTYEFSACKVQSIHIRIRFGKSTIFSTTLANEWSYQFTLYKELASVTSLAIRCDKEGHYGEYDVYFIPSLSEA